MRAKWGIPIKSICRVPRKLQSLQGAEIWAQSWMENCSPHNYPPLKITQGTTARNLNIRILHCHFFTDDNVCLFFHFTDEGSERVSGLEEVTQPGCARITLASRAQTHDSLYCLIPRVLQLLRAFIPGQDTWNRRLYTQPDLLREYAPQHLLKCKHPNQVLLKALSVTAGK